MGQKLNFKIIFALLLNIMIWEVVLRLFIASPSTQEFDEVIGYKNRPFTRYIESQEGYAISRFNSLGFNDEEPKKDIDLRKIVVLGDSYTAALQVPVGQGYPQLLEEMLNAGEKAYQYDVIKLARAAFIPVHYPEVARRYFSDIRPDLVIIQLGGHSGGDLYGQRVFITYDGNSSISELKAQPKQEDLLKEQFRWLMNNSSLAYLIIRKYKRVIMEYIDKIRRSLKKDNSLSLILNTDVNILEDMKKRFGFILDDILSYGHRVVVLYLPAPNGLKRIKQGEDNLIPIKSACKERSIKVVDLSHVFQSSYAEKKTLLYGFQNTLQGTGHLNRHGHRVVADALFQAIDSANKLSQ